MGERNNKEIITPSKATISEHIKHIFEEGELDEKAANSTKKGASQKVVVRNFQTTTLE